MQRYNLLCLFDVISEATLNLEEQHSLFHILVSIVIDHIMGFEDILKKICITNLTYLYNYSQF